MSESKKVPSTIKFPLTSTFPLTSRSLKKLTFLDTSSVPAINVFPLLASTEKVVPMLGSLVFAEKVPGSPFGPFTPAGIPKLRTASLPDVPTFVTVAVANIS